MNPTLPALILLLLLTGCASTKPIARAAPALNPVSSNPTAAVPETVVLSPGQLASPTVAGSVRSVPPPASRSMPALSAEQVQPIPFQVSVSSVTVERLAAQQGCKGGKGASLVTEKGPIEVYKMICDSGKVFLAKCELRQCKSFNW